MPSRARTIGWLVLIAALAALPVGCSQDQIAVYEVPYHKQRLLGAIVNMDDSAWFFKLMGDADDVAANRDSFLSFVRTLRFPNAEKEPVAWTLPEGWKAEVATGMRYATIYIPRNQVVTVSRLPQRGGGNLANLNRWRDQLKLPPIDNAEYRKLAELIRLENGLTAEVVDMEGARAVAEIAMADEPKPTNKPLEFKKPEGWTEIADPVGIAKSKFRVEDGGQSADVTVTPLGGDAGGNAENINRWRKQIGLPEATDEAIKKENQTLEVAGDKCVYVDLVGPEGAKRKRILGVICPRGEQTWFIKMTGPDELVAKQRPTFESFARSIRFGGGN